MEYAEGTPLVSLIEPGHSNGPATDRPVSLEWDVTGRLALNEAIKRRRRLRIAQRTAAAAVSCATARVACVQ